MKLSSKVKGEKTQATERNYNNKRKKWVKAVKWLVLSNHYRPKNTLWRIQTVTLCTISLGKTHSEGYNTDVSATKSSKHVLLFTGMELVWNFDHKYSCNPPNGHSHTWTAVLKVPSQSPRFTQLPYKLCIFTFLYKARAPVTDNFFSILRVSAYKSFHCIFNSILINDLCTTNFYPLIIIRPNYYWMELTWWMPTWKAFSAFLNLIWISIALLVRRNTPIGVTTPEEVGPRPAR